MESHFLAYMYRLKYIKRWSLMRNITHESVAEHTFHVALLTHMLCTISREVFRKDVPTDKLVSMALFHDATEVFTGDIPTPVKHQNPEILANFRKIEDKAARRMTKMLPKELQSVYKPLLEGGKESEPHAILIKAADLLDAYVKCTMEVSAGNREFAYAKKQIEQTLEELDLPEVRYWLEVLAPSLEKTLDELSE